MIRTGILLVLASSVCAGELQLEENDPQVVRDLATTAAQQWCASSTQQTQFVYAYLDGFKSGLVTPGCIASMGSGKPDDPTSVGFALGRSTAISNAPTLGVGLSEYGYTHTNVTGHVFLDFELSELRPVGGTQVWSIAWSRDFDRKYSRLVYEHHISRLNRTAIRATLSGHLSPEIFHGYGHFSVYKREFVVEKIIEMKQEPQPSATPLPSTPQSGPKEGTR